MSNGDSVVVVDVDRVRKHGIVGQGLLELRCHEVITRAGPRQNTEVNLEPEQIKEKGKDDETHGTRRKMIGELRKVQSATRTVDVEKIPQVNDNSGTDSDEGEEADILDGHIARQCEAGQDEPLPPLTAKGFVAQFVELDITQETACHGEDQGGVEKNQACLTNVSVVKEHQAGRDNARWNTIGGFPHDQEDDGYSQSTQQSGQGAESNVGDMVCDVRVTNILEVEVAIISDEPSGKSEKELSQGWVDVQEVGSLQVEGCELEYNDGMGLTFFFLFFFSIFS